MTFLNHRHKHQRPLLAMATLLAVAAACWVFAEPAEAQGRKWSDPGPSASSGSRSSGSSASSSSSSSSSSRSSGSSGSVSSAASGKKYSGHLERRRHGGGHRHGHGHHGSYYPYYYSFGYHHGPYYYYPFGYTHYSGYGYPYRYGHYGSGSGGYFSGEKGLGALDLNVRPKKAQVYLNGQYVGTVKEYDGFPSYLWLEEGVYNVVFYLEGYETLTKKVTVYPGLTIDVEDRLVAGASTAPEELAPESMAPPPEAAAADAAQREQVSAQEQEWRERARAYRERQGAEGAGEGSLDARREPARVHLSVAPADASVYLDGRFLGTGEKLSQLHAGLTVDPGEHLVEIVRPGFETDGRVFEVAAGEELTLDFSLSKGAGG